MFHEKENSSFLWEEEVANAVLAFAYGLDNALNNLCRGRKAVKCKEVLHLVFLKKVCIDNFLVIKALRYLQTLLKLKLLKIKLNYNISNE